MNRAAPVRAVRRDDLAALRAVIDATELFPSHLLDDMLDAFLAGETLVERWMTFDVGNGPFGVAYSASERMTDGTSNLLLIAVHPDHQGQGVGQTLMREAETSLAARGQRLLLVETSGLPEFERTRDFYRRLGYTEKPASATTTPPEMTRSSSGKPCSEDPRRNPVPGVSILTT